MMPMMPISAVYHWWGSPEDAPPYANLRAPILLSIATLRAVSDIPVKVLDLTGDVGDPGNGRPSKQWAHFPKKLNFEVIGVPAEYKNYKRLVPGWMHLSRIQDVASWPFYHGNPQTTVYVDSDVFFFRNPLPLEKNTSKFCFNGWNSGFYYHNNYDTTEFFDIFGSYIKAAIFSEEVRKVMRQYVPYDAWYGVWDEMILTYMVKNHPELFDLIGVNEHCTANTIEAADPATVKMFHANGTMMANEFPKNPGEKEHCRGLLCLVVKEFYDNIRKVLDDKDLAMVFTEIERRHYLPQQFSLLENVSRLSSIRRADGHFHVKDCLRPPLIIL